MKDELKILNSIRGLRAAARELQDEGSIYVSEK